MGLLPKFNGQKWKHWFHFSFLISLPLYFVLDGSNKFWGFVPILSNLLVFAAIVIGFCCLHFFLRRITTKFNATVLSVWLMLLFLFFKVLKEKLLQLSQVSALQQYKFFLPLLFLFTILFYLLLRVIPHSSRNRLVSYLNALFIVLVLIEIGYVVNNAIRNKPNELATDDHLIFKKIENQITPNIYFFVLDEYVGSSTLKEHFGFNNDEFENSLKGKNFFVPQVPNSNYNYTPFSILSILNMGYIEGYDKSELYSGIAVNKCVKAIRSNRLTSFFAGNHYKIINNSFFRMGTENYIRKLFLPTEERLLLDKTFGNVLWNDLLCSVNSNRFHFLVSDGIARTEMYNQMVYKKTLNNIKKNKTPHFMYSHFMMPHFPYLRTKEGTLRNMGQVYRESNEGRDIRSYVDYLQYCNSIILELIDRISSSDPGAIVVIASDHGIRGATVGDKFFNEFNNFLAVRVSDNKYDGFTDTMGMVNVFRCILRNQFLQEIPLIENKMINVNPGLHIKDVN